MEEADQRVLCSQLGRVAKRSSSALNEDLCDLGSLLSQPTFKDIMDPEKLPESYFKQWMLKYLELHKFRGVTWGLTPPGAAKVLEERTQVKQQDLLIAVTLITPIFDQIWRDYKLIWKGEIFDFSPGQVTEFTLWCNDICAVTVDGRTLPLIGGLVYLADILGVEIVGGRNNNGAPDDFEIRAFDPTLEVKYEVLKHVPRTCLLEHFRMPLTPLEDLSKWISTKPCAIIGPLLYRETKIQTACEELASVFWTTQATIKKERIQKTSARVLPPRRGITSPRKAGKIDPNLDPTLD